MDFQWKEYEKAKHVKYSKNFSKVKSKTNHYLSTPVIINNFNQTNSLLPLIQWLKRAKLDNIYLIDNHSTLPGIKDYYDSLNLRVFYLEENLGPNALWRSNLSELFCQDYYIYTDSDILPISECPLDFLQHFYHLLDAHLFISKVGFGLTIHDLPDHYPFKTNIIENELKVTAKNQEFEHGYFSSLGTSFALYKPRTAGGFNLPAIRTKFPYLIKHLGWYSHPYQLRDEEKFYYQNVRYLTKWTLPYLQFLTKDQHLICHSLNDFFGCVYIFSPSLSDSLAIQTYLKQQNIYTKVSPSLLGIFVESLEKSYRSILILGTNLQPIADLKLRFQDQLEKLDQMIPPNQSWKILNLSFPNGWLKHNSDNLLSDIAIGFHYSVFQPIISVFQNITDTNQSTVLLNILEHSKSHIITFQSPLMVPNLSNVSTELTTILPNTQTILVVGEKLPGPFSRSIKQWLNENSTNQITLFGNQIESAFINLYPNQIKHYHLDTQPIKLSNLHPLNLKLPILNPLLPDSLGNEPLTQVRIGFNVYQMIKTHQIQKPTLILCDETGLYGYFITCIFPGVPVVNHRELTMSENKTPINKILDTTFRLATTFHSNLNLDFNSNSETNLNILIKTLHESNLNMNQRDIKSGGDNQISTCL